MNQIRTSQKRKISIWLDFSVLEYFKGLAKETGVPYQRLINQYLLDCTQNKKLPSSIKE